MYRGKFEKTRGERSPGFCVGGRTTEAIGAFKEEAASRKGKNTAESRIAQSQNMAEKSRTTKKYGKYDDCELENDIRAIDDDTDTTSP